MFSHTTIQEVHTPSETVGSAERRRPSLLGRLLTLLFLGLAVGLGALIFIPIAVLGLALVVSFAVYLFLYRLFSRSPRAPGGEGRENVRVVVRDGSP